jgi:Trypsin-like peptidase domain
MAHPGPPYDRPKRGLRGTRSYVALNDTIPRTVAFIISQRKKAGAVRQTPIGTGFLLGVRTPPEPQFPVAFTLYLVTAAHVVRSEPMTWVRLRRMDGTLTDIPIPEWTLHERDDVALTVLELDETAQPYDVAVLPIPDFLPSYAAQRYGDERRPRYRPMLGDRVYFVGLFAPISAMGEQNVPLVRSGTLAAWNQERVPVRMPDGTVLEYTAHLIDSRSYSGFSGSPCFVQFPIGPGIGGIGRPHEETELLGLVASHFDFTENAKLTGELSEMGKVDIPVHLGVAVVMPAESIEELLDREDVVADRKEREKKYLDQEGNESASTPDVVDAESGSEFERFEDLARELVNTPKRDKKNDEGGS